MIDPHEFAQKQLELTAEFGKYVMDHPDVDDVLPPESHIYFEVAGEDEFNCYSRQLAEQCVKVKGLAPPQRSRLIDPVVQAVSAVA